MSKENKHQPGCYGDGSFGPDHTRRKVFEIAMSEGWEPDISIEDVLGFTADSDSIFGYIQDLEEAAIFFLNERCRDEGCYWGYENGDFGYWESEEE